MIVIRLVPILTEAGGSRVLDGHVVVVAVVVVHRVGLVCLLRVLKLAGWSWGREEHAERVVIRLIPILTEAGWSRGRDAHVVVVVVCRASPEPVLLLSVSAVAGWRTSREAKVVGHRVSALILRLTSGSIGRAMGLQVALDRVAVRAGDELSRLEVFGLRHVEPEDVMDGRSRTVAGEGARLAPAGADGSRSMHDGGSRHDRTVRHLMKGHDGAGCVGRGRAGAGSAGSAVWLRALALVLADPGLSTNAGATARREFGVDALLSGLVAGRAWGSAGALEGRVSWLGFSLFMAWMYVWTCPWRCRGVVVDIP